MKLREFLNNHACNSKTYTFVISKAVKEEHAPGYYYGYVGTPLRTIHEWMHYDMVDKYIVINPKHPPIDIPGHWVHQYDKGWINCCIITTEEDMRTMYSETQAQQMLDWYDDLVRKYVQDNLI